VKTARARITHTNPASVEWLGVDEHSCTGARRRRSTAP